jgi:hypothetical protein
MIRKGFQKGYSSFEPPIETRFVDLFLLIIAALMFIAVMLSIISTSVGSTHIDVAPQTAQLHIASDTIILPDAVSNTAYTFHFFAKGGTPPYQWSLVQGKLPPSLHLTPSGDVVGTPTQENTSWIFTVRAIDAHGISITQRVRLLVGASPPSVWENIWTVVFWIFFAIFFLFGGPGIIDIIRGFLARRSN